MTAVRRSVVVERFGDPSVLRPRTDPLPLPGPGQALVRVLASGVARADALMRSGRYPRGPRPPFVPGWDVAGHVEDVGGGVPAEWLGRRVVALVPAGGYTSHAVVPAERLVPVPDGTDLHAAACLPLNYVTAYQLLHRVADVGPGDRVLVRGASGGVGTALLDLAARAGAVVFGSASARGRDVVRSFGAEFVDDASADLRGIAPDVVLDSIGGDGLTRSLRALSDGGVLVSFGFLAGLDRPALLRQAARVLGWSALPNGRRVRTYRLSAAVRRAPGQVRDDLATLVGHLAAGELRTLVAGALPLDRAADAHRALEDRAVRGKLLLTP
ncbi:zinc-binding dehydrogenase [Myceligenerans pegani]|uniref:Zinc-binding dehydrogenase n=1 Tax=Myceligenerans pegani TaxID=2776917 RepID=A0ABR9N1Y2_9MICO|nr:zinc-binding dehydrogenase [Myceligenerans sp. TRM 65318]MBE1877666.1 zinc-binding dehydrogenase [Myceligenerans sp. TRM 65318]MBE3019937.1 zinc-binding dehydrogenase [Myceligenerans sp. TRM 65318]